MSAKPALVLGMLCSAVVGTVAVDVRADEAATFLRGLNLNGPAVTIDGRAWDGLDSQHYVCKDQAFEQQGVPLVPATDAERAKMLRSSRWGGNRVELTDVPNGTCTVFLYVWEDNDAETFSIAVNGREVVPRYDSGATGQWAKLGPWPVEVTDGRIVLTSKGGAANFSGIELWRGQHDGSDTTPIAAEDLAFFEGRIRPLLVKHCYECHSTESDELAGDLLVDSRPTLRHGGATGPAVVPGDLDRSLLIEAVRYKNDDLQMPPEGKLSTTEISDLERWVQSGAPDPRATATKFTKPRFDVTEARRFWSLRPVADPPAPSVAATDWPANEIDHFVLAALEERGLEPIGDADKPTLLRRATYDLTGLPPTPEELDAFLVDDSPEAFARVVDRLLDSSRYGERWGRHWMDLVRYADTAGDNSDYPVPQAYLYRNYVIDAFNADKPYDEFLREQIAGDLLPAANDLERNEHTIATGYLAISRRFGSIVNDYPQHLTIEDSLDNIGRVVLGLTITCARCHDHEFDPITQADYYGLYGILDSTRYPFPGIELDKKPRDFVPLFEDGKPGRSLAYAMAEGTPHDARLHVRGEPRKPGDVVPRSFLEVLGGQTLSAEESQYSGRLQLAEWLTAADNPLTPRVMVNRLWQHHFGRGLVTTPSDFGIRGTPPTHPELLDWLATRFVQEGWSIKRMHRRMMLSRAYRLDSRIPADSVATVEAHTVDPENQLHWRFDRQRLDAESLRDTLLFLGGDLDERMPREPHPFPPVEKWEFTQHHPFRDSYESNVRSVYLMTARLNARPFFTTFDGADRNASTATRDRSVTTVQSLYLLNDEFVHARAAAFAERVLEAPGDETGRIAIAFERTTGRRPTSDELSAAKAWITEMRVQLKQTGTPEDRLQAESFTAFARVLFRLNEFLYVD